MKLGFGMAASLISFILFSTLLWSGGVVCPVHKAPCTEQAVFRMGSGIVSYVCTCGDSFLVDSAHSGGPGAGNPNQPILPGVTPHSDMGAIAEKPYADCRAQGWVIYRGTCMSPQRRDIEIKKNAVKEQCRKSGGIFREEKKPLNMWLCFDKTGNLIDLK